MKSQKLIPLGIGLSLAMLALGWILGVSLKGGHDHGSAAAGGDGTLWTCSMHPQIQALKPGKCPICAMDLIPLANDKGKQSNPRELVMTEAARELAKIETAPVERRIVEAEVELVGKVAFDETRTRTMAARFPGRIDRLYVDYTGIEVHKGDHLANIYSPELLTAQQELISAIRFESNVETARDKLRLWDVSEARIKEIEELGKPNDRMDIDAVLGGVVITKHVNEGDYVKTGEPLFTIADLTSVWVQIDAYESDLPWLRFGQRVEFEAEAVPGRAFEGTISFVAPTLDPKTRTIHIRVNADNPRQLLKPEMLVRARVFAKLAAQGKVIAPELKDKWISPMHPEVVRDKPGPCPVCGMALVKAEELGYAVLDETEAPPLIVPASAVLRTGKRSVVYVEVPDAEKPTYEGREIVIGPRAGDFYLVEEGLKFGERVVTQGNFKIDSALQIVAKPSMMNPSEDKGEPKPKFEVTPVFHELFGGVFVAYLDNQEALAADSLDDSKAAANALVGALGKVDIALLQGDARIEWIEQLAALRGGAGIIAEADSLDDARIGFLPLSTSMLGLTRDFGLNPGDSAVEVHCSMAFDNIGASWLQLGKEVRNPYYGAEMLKCGDVKRTITEIVKRYETDPSFREQLGALLLGYFRLSNALAGDDFESAKKEVAALGESLAKVDMSAVSGDAHMAWMRQHEQLTKALEGSSSAQDIAKLRVSFEPLSIAMTEAVKTFGPTGAEHVYQVHCPMAFDFKGASWLQANKEVLNPYFGDEMLNCGAVKQELTSNSEKP